MNQQQNDKEDWVPAGIGRRLGAMFYDAVLILAIFIVTAFLLIPFTGPIPATNIIFPLLLYIEIGAFYIYFWCANGQTLGMQTWRLLVVNERDRRIDPVTGILRFTVATISFLGLGFGFLWAFTNKNRLMFHDQASDTRVVFTGKPKKQKEKTEPKEDRKKKKPESARSPK